MREHFICSRMKKTLPLYAFKRLLSEITCLPFLTGENLGINHPTPMTKPSPKRASVN